MYKNDSSYTSTRQADVKSRQHLQSKNERNHLSEMQNSDLAHQLLFPARLTAIHARFDKKKELLAMAYVTPHISILVLLSMFSLLHGQKWTLLYGSEATGTPDNDSANVFGARANALAWLLPGSNFSDPMIIIYGGAIDFGSGDVEKLADLWAWNVLKQTWTYLAENDLIPVATAPGYLDASVTWVSNDADEILLFSGAGYDENGNDDLLSDVWRLQLSNNTPTWTHLYGNLLSSQPSSTTAPGARAGAAGWTDRIGRYWLFGGYGYGIDGLLDVLNDLWIYNISSGWIHVNGSLGTMGPSQYGAQPPSVGYPSPRTYAFVAYCAQTDTVYMFGGRGTFGHSNTNDEGDLQDMWAFDPSNAVWTWIGGAADEPGSSSVGTQGVFSPSNLPEGREGGAAWIDPSDPNMFLFIGGWNIGSDLLYNDMWYFNISSGQFAWAEGNPTPGAELASSGYPSDRAFMSVSGSGSNFYIIAGESYLNNGEKTTTQASVNEVWCFGNCTALHNFSSSSSASSTFSTSSTSSASSTSSTSLSSSSLPESGSQTPVQSGSSAVTIIVAASVCSGLALILLIAAIFVYGRRKRGLQPTDHEMSQQLDLNHPPPTAEPDRTSSSDEKKASIYTQQMQPSEMPPQPRVLDNYGNAGNVAPAAPVHHRGPTDYAAAPMATGHVVPSEGMLRVQLQTQIDAKEITLDKELGRGAFGVVYAGTWGDKPVAVKQHPQVLGEKEKSDVLAEIAIMLELGDHPNVVKIYGVCFDPLLIVMPLYANGGLLRHLRSEAGYGGQLSQRLKILYEICCGMCHLHAHGVVHRDIAARNILLGNEMQAVISDLGLARIVEGTEEGKTIANTGPIRWMAPECLFGRKYSRQSDVWAFAVTAWEVLTRGAQPYKDLPLMEIPQRIREGVRLEFPEDCPAYLSTVLKTCWSVEPEKRPTFPDMKEVLNLMRSYEEKQY